MAAGTSPPLLEIVRVLRVCVLLAWPEEHAVDDARHHTAHDGGSDVHLQHRSHPGLGISDGALAACSRHARLV